MNIRSSSLAAALFVAAISPPPLDAQFEPADYVPSATIWELDTEYLHATDINRLAATLVGRFQAFGLDWSTSLGRTRLNVDYAPVRSADVIGRFKKLSRNNTSVQIQGSRSILPYTDFWLSAGFYDGFTNHNSLWLDEYYRQQFSRFDGYVAASPRGYNAGAGLVHDFGRWPGVLGVAVNFSQDDVAPGYDRPLFQELERGRERLFAGGLTLSLESVPLARVRLRHELRLSDVTDRDLRISYRGNLNVALAEAWVVRAELAYTGEPSRSADQADFHAESVALTLERDWSQRWFLSAHVRGYRDNGQIETSILVSAGPPPLETSQWGIALRHRGDRWTWKLGAASYRTRFDEIASPIRPFGNLYRDRDWALLDSTFGLTF